VQALEVALGASGQLERVARGDDELGLAGATHPASQELGQLGVADRPVLSVAPQVVFEVVEQHDHRHCRQDGLRERALERRQRIRRVGRR
jgi:hypothetical protein